jgi:hypothetical protein
MSTKILRAVVSAGEFAEYYDDGWSYGYGCAGVARYLAEGECSLTGAPQSGGSVQTAGSPEGQASAESSPVSRGETKDESE